MTLRGARIVRNMLLIGGTTTTLSFGFSLAKSRGNLPQLDYSLNDGKLKEIKTISNIDNIEDFEFQKECKFFFYKKKGGKFDQAEIKGARGFSESTKTQESEIVSKVNTNKEKCEKNRFVYIEFP